MLDRDAILGVLRTIPDPEMPISIVDLGLVENVHVDPRSSEGASSGRTRIEIELLPTFVGCPALEMIANAVRAKVGALPGDHQVVVHWRFDPPWTVDRISPAGRESLKAHGVTVPDRRPDEPGHHSPAARTARGVGVPTILRTSAIACPFCGSTNTHLDSPFGPTRCRMIYYCTACRNSFEHLKRV